MDWFYAENGQQVGPVSEAQLDDLLRQGRINLRTLVWHSGLSQWTSLESARAVEPAGSPPLLDTAACAECEQVFPQQEMVVLNRSWVCARCKPIFLQRLREGAAPRTGALWRSKRHLIMRQETPLPDRCVKCNRPANGYKLKRRLYWHHPAIYLLILLNLLIYVIVAIIVRKRAVVIVPLCEEHRSRRVWTVAGCWLAGLAGLPLSYYGFSSDAAGLAVGGILLSLAALLVGAIFAPPLAAVRIDPDFVRLRGAQSAFLDTLPEWEGPG